MDAVPDPVDETPPSDPDPAADAVPEWALGYTNPPSGTNGVGPEYVSLTPTEDGRWRLSGMLDADHGAIVDAALNEMFDRLRRDGDRHATRTDALIAIAHASLDAAPSERRDRFRINLFLEPTVSPRATWIDGYVLPDATRTCPAANRLSHRAVAASRSGRPGRRPRSGHYAIGSVPTLVSTPVRCGKPS